ncbi:MAG: PadR family transcriptional regulator [Proteobacteria bacterium]|nr:PadR family transcriptional regulator [Pseudomonadota bacterium]
MNGKNRTKYTLLGMLAIEPMSGYEIKKAIERSTSYFWSESDGQIYPALSHCVEKGWATCHEEGSKTSTRTKKIYKITSQGKEELRSWLIKKVQPNLLRNELLLKLFFGKNVKEQENIHHVRVHEKEIKEGLNMFLSIRDNLKSNHKNSPDLKYWLITLDHGITMSKAELKWCKDTLIVLENAGRIS